MTRRTRNWDESLAEDLKDPVFAKEFLLAAVEEEISLQDALAKVITCYGIKEFAKKIGMQSSNLIRAIDKNHNPTQETINKLLKPFGLVIGIKPINVHMKKAA
jgi:DNA-binding phage protein